MSINYPIQIDKDGQYIIIRENENYTVVDKIYEIWNAEVSERINGEYIFNFETVPTSRIMELLKPPNFIEVDNDYFRIRTIKKSRNDSLRMAVECEHISYRLNDEPKFKGKSYWGRPSSIITDILTNAEPFDLGKSDFTAQVEFDSGTAGKRSRIIELANYVGGEAHFNKVKVSIIKRRGTDHGVRLEVGKNVVSLTETIEYDNTETKSISSYEADIVDLNFVIDDKTGTPLEMHDIHLGDTLELVDNDLLIDKKDRVIAITYDPFKHLLPTIEFANQAEDLYNNAWSTSTDNKSAQAFFFAENVATKTVNTTEAMILNQDIVAIRDTYFDVSFMMNITTTGSNSIMFTFLVDGTRFGEYKHDMPNAGTYLISVDRFINNLVKGTKVINVMAKCSSGTISIPSKKITMLVRTSGVLGGASQERPDRSVIDEWNQNYSRTAKGPSLDKPTIKFNAIIKSTAREIINYEYSKLNISQSDKVTITTKVE